VKENSRETLRWGAEGSNGLPLPGVTTKNDGDLCAPRPTAHHRERRGRGEGNGKEMRAWTPRVAASGVAWLWQAIANSRSTK